MHEHDHAHLTLEGLAEPMQKVSSNRNTRNFLKKKPLPLKTDTIGWKLRPPIVGIN
jgi:hypothetical protein